jgi:predicted phosphate transport protein (TIGR00153 family)
MRFRLKPRNDCFYELFTSAGENLITGSNVLSQLIGQPAAARPELAKCLREVEHRGDEITHELLKEVNSTFVTPFDREDIVGLASRVDDVMDFLESAGDLIVLYGLCELPEEFGVMAQALCAAAKAAADALARLNEPGELQPYFVEANRLENEADGLYRTFLARLFSGAFDTLTVLKLKGVVDELEAAADALEHVADMMETIAVKEA